MSFLQTSNIYFLLLKVLEHLDPFLRGIHALDIQGQPVYCHLNRGGGGIPVHCSSRTPHGLRKRGEKKSQEKDQEEGRRREARQKNKCFEENSKKSKPLEYICYILWVVRPTGGWEPGQGNRLSQVPAHKGEQWSDGTTGLCHNIVNY